MHDMLSHYFNDMPSKSPSAAILHSMTWPGTDQAAMRPAPPCGWKLWKQHHCGRYQAKGYQ